MKGFKSENTMLRNPENGYIYKIETHCHTSELSPCGFLPFRELIEQEPVVREHLTDEELDSCFDLSYHYKHVDEVFERLGLQ